MAQEPKPATGSRLSNIMGVLNGNFPFRTAIKTPAPRAFGGTELISKDVRSKLLGAAERKFVPEARASLNTASFMALIQTSLSKVGQHRMENRKILKLLPNVEKAARLMTASTFSPNDLTRQAIQIKFDYPGLSASANKRLSDFATDFFEEKFQLKTKARDWVYEWGYETGAYVKAVIPLQSFTKLNDAHYLGVESLVTGIIDPISQESLFGFGDGRQIKAERTNDWSALESFSAEAVTSAMQDIYTSHDGKKFTAPTDNKVAKDLMNKMLGLEAISLTDNPSVLQAASDAKDKAQKATSKKVKDRFAPKKGVFGADHKRVIDEPIVIIDGSRDPDTKPGSLGEPLVYQLPPESVSVVHTPGDPTDHQGYLVLLDRMGNPLTAVVNEENGYGQSVSYSQQQGNLFNQIYDAYGMGPQNTHQALREQSMQQIYTAIMGQYLSQRVDKAGFSNATISNQSSIFRTMFARFLQAKHTRILFLPKDLVSYMTFEMDDQGNGVSRLEGIKFPLAMKMTVQVSRVLATIKNSMDKRTIEINFGENNMDQPEFVFQNVIEAYQKKALMDFSCDPNVIQSQIADKAVTIKGTGIPGMEGFSISNDPDTRTSSGDIDPDISADLDKQILNGLKIPPAAMNALSEDEYARSVTTTNLLFAMDVAMDQDVTIFNISDFLRKYARFSESFQSGIRDIFPSQGTAKDKPEPQGADEQLQLPDKFDMEALIDTMSITLPMPNLAPSKAQFDSLEAMATSITSTINALIPDDLIGSDDTLGTALKFIRARLITTNVRKYLDTSGMTNFDVPDTDFSELYKDSTDLLNALGNMSQMMKKKAEIQDSTNDSVEGSPPASGIIPSGDTSGLSTTSEPGSDDPFPGF